MAIEAALPSENRTWDRETARGIIAELKALPGASLPILHALQERFGCIPDDAIPLITDALLLSRAEVIGIIEFYHDFRRQPVGRHVMKICRAEACQSMGCERLVEHVCGRVGVGMGETTPDGALTLETVYCLGNCALSPAVLLDGDLYGRVTPDRADALIERARAGR